MNKTNRLDLFSPRYGFLIAVALAMTFLLGACEDSVSTPTADAMVREIQTDVVGTVGAQVSSTQTLTLSASATPTPDGTEATSTPTPTPTYSYSYPWYWDYSTYYKCNSSEFIRDVTIPNGTVLSPGESFTKTWKFKNVGRCTWQEDYLLVFVGGSKMGGSTTYLDTIVLPNKRGDASVVLTAPTTAGTYYGYWKLADEDGNTFGEKVSVKIVVEDDATSTATSTPTSTGTITVSPTQTLTSTPVATEPVVDTPTSTQTNTPTSTETPTEVPTAVPTEIPTEVSTVTAPTVDPAGTVSTFLLTSS